MMILVLTLLLNGPTDEWTRFRGPNGTGISTAVNLPVEFGPEKNVVWKTPLPPGHSSPILTEKQIFLTAHAPLTGSDYKLLVIALDRATGKISWERDVPRVNKGRIENVNGPASPSAVTDGSNVYAFFQEFGLISLTSDGKERWRLPLGPFNMFYGFGASPILVDGTLILSVDQDLGAAGDGLYDLRQDLDRSWGMIQLPPAVVRDVHAVHAMFHGSPRIIGHHNPLEDQGQAR